MMVKYVQRFDEAESPVHFLEMKHLNSYETMELVLSSTQQHYALRGVSALFTICSFEYSYAKDSLRLIRASLEEAEAVVLLLETV